MHFPARRRLTLYGLAVVPATLVLTLPAHAGASVEVIETPESCGVLLAVRGLADGEHTATVTVTSAATGELVGLLPESGADSPGSGATSPEVGAASPEAGAASPEADDDAAVPSRTTTSLALTGDDDVLLALDPDEVPDDDPRVDVAVLLDGEPAAEVALTLETCGPTAPGTPTPRPSGTPTPEPSGTPTPSPSGTPSPSPSGTASPSPSGTPTPGTSATPSPSASGTPTPSTSPTTSPPAGGTATPPTGGPARPGPTSGGAPSNGGPTSAPSVPAPQRPAAPVTGVPSTSGTSTSGTSSVTGRSSYGTSWVPYGTGRVPSGTGDSGYLPSLSWGASSPAGDPVTAPVPAPVIAPPEGAPAVTSGEPVALSRPLDELFGGQEEFAEQSPAQADAVLAAPRLTTAPADPLADLVPAAFVLTASVGGMLTAGRRRRAH